MNKQAFSSLFLTLLSSTDEAKKDFKTRFYPMGEDIQCKIEYFESAGKNGLSLLKRIQNDHNNGLRRMSLLLDESRCAIIFMFEPGHWDLVELDSIARIDESKLGELVYVFFMSDANTFTTDAAREEFIEKIPFQVKKLKKFPLDTL